MPIASVIHVSHSSNWIWHAHRQISPLVTLIQLDMDMCRLGTVQGGEDEVRKVLDDFQAPTSSFSLDKHEKEINDCFGRETVCGPVCLFCPLPGLTRPCHRYPRKFTLLKCCTLAALHCSANAARPQMEEVLAALERTNTDFAQGIRGTIMAMSPTSCKVTLRQVCTPSSAVWLSTTSAC
jgi:hypothetical protein